MNKKYILVIVVILIVIISGFFYLLHKQKSQRGDDQNEENLAINDLLFSASYLYTAEATYQEIKINQSKLTFTYFEDTSNKCVNWIQQSPCWGKKDLITKEIILSEKEISDLTNLIKKTGFMDLNNTYGGAGEYQRYYPYKLSVSIADKTKEVIYQSFPGASAMPKAFEEVKKQLNDLTSRKIKKV